jgi:hypothetical protein
VNEQPITEGSRRNAEAAPGGPEAALPHRSATARRVSRFTPSRHRSWWKWALIALLLCASLGLTLLYAAVLTSDVIVHPWTDALEASQDAVPAVIGWAALIYVFFKGGTPAAERMLSIDNLIVQRAEEQTEEDRSAAEDGDRSVRELTERLASAVARRDAAGADAGPGPNQEVTEIESHLEQARRSLESRRQAAAKSQASLADAEAKLVHDFPDPRVPQEGDAG